MLILDGKVTKQDSKIRHPRTMVGYDKEQNYLYFVVIDGRQNGYSEGMTGTEQSQLMKELGCWEALNLDGGGSSVLVIKTADNLAIVNQPPKRNIRPIPSLLGIRKKL